MMKLGSLCGTSLSVFCRGAVGLLLSQKQPGVSGIVCMLQRQALGAVQCGERGEAGWDGA